MQQVLRRSMISSAPCRWMPNQSMVLAAESPYIDAPAVRELYRVGVVEYVGMAELTFTGHAGPRQSVVLY